MPVHVDVLDEQESLRAPFLGSIALHATVAGLLVLSTLNFERSQPTWGGATHAGDAVPVSVFNHIPLPSKSGHPNPVANDTESQVPQAVKPAPKKKVQVPEKAQPIKSRAVKEQPKQQSLQRHRAEPIRENQVLSQENPAAVTPMFQKPGGAVGLGQNSTLGSRFGAYADLVAQRVTDKWQTAGLPPSSSIAIITFEILRDGSVRNAKVAQTSGNSALDFSALRAVTDAAPFPPLPAGYDKNDAGVELQFHLQK